MIEEDKHPLREWEAYLLCYLHSSLFFLLCSLNLFSLANLTFYFYTYTKHDDGDDLTRSPQRSPCMQ
jgi:hypothetical protein